MPIEEQQLRGVGKLDAQPTQLVDDPEIDRLLQIEHGIYRGLLHEIRQLELE